MAIIKKSTNNKCWRGCGEKRTLLYFCWECKLVQPLCRTVWRFLKKTKNRAMIWSSKGFPGGSDSKESAAMQENQVLSLGEEDLLKKEMTTHSSMLAWRIPWTEEPGGLQSRELQRVGHDWATNTHTHTHTQWSSNPTPGHTSRENHTWKRYLHPTVHSSTIYYSQDMEAT